MTEKDKQTGIIFRSQDSVDAKSIDSGLSSWPFSCVTLSTSLHLSAPQLPHLENGDDNSTYLKELL